MTQLNLTLNIEDLKDQVANSGILMPLLNLPSMS